MIFTTSFESRAHNGYEANSSQTSNGRWHGHSSQLSSPVSSPTGKLKSFHEFESGLSGVDKIRRVEEICIGRVSPSGSPGSSLRWNASRVERHQPVSLTNASRNCRIEENLDKDKEARKSESPSINTDSFAGKGD